MVKCGLDTQKCHVSFIDGLIECGLDTRKCHVIYRCQDVLQRRKLKEEDKEKMGKKEGGEGRGK